MAREARTPRAPLGVLMFLSAMLLALSGLLDDVIQGMDNILVWAGLLAAPPGAAAGEGTALPFAVAQADVPLAAPQIGDLILEALSVRTLMARMDAALRQPELRAQMGAACARAGAVRDAGTLFSAGLSGWIWDGPAPTTPVVGFTFYVRLCSPFVALDMPGEGGTDQARGGLVREGTTFDAALDARCLAATEVSPILPIRAGEDPARVAWAELAAREAARTGRDAPPVPYTITHAHAAARNSSRLSERQLPPQDGFAIPHIAPYTITYDLVSGQGLAAGGGKWTMPSGEAGVPPPRLMPPLTLSLRATLCAELDGQHDRLVVVAWAGVSGLAEDGGGGSASYAISAMACMTGPLPLLYLALESGMLQEWTPVPPEEEEEEEGGGVGDPTFARLPRSLLAPFASLWAAAASNDSRGEIAALTQGIAGAFDAARRGQLLWQQDLTGPSPNDCWPWITTVQAEWVDVSRVGVNRSGGPSPAFAAALATHPAALHLMRAAALARCGSWGAVIHDIHSALAWGAGLYLPGTDADDQLSRASRARLPPKLYADAYLLLGRAWQALACPQAALDCLNQAVASGVPARAGETRSFTVNEPDLIGPCGLSAQVRALATALTSRDPSSPTSSGIVHRLTDISEAGWDDEAVTAASISLQGRLEALTGPNGRPRLTLTGAGPHPSMILLPPRPSGSAGDGAAAGRSMNGVTRSRPRLAAVYWHTSTFVPPPVTGGAAARSQGRVFVFGGCGEAGPGSELAVCDIATRAWVSLASLPTSPPGHLYLHAAALLFPPSTGAVKAPEEVQEAARACAGAGRQILFLGGTGCPEAMAPETHTLREPWLFDTASLRWGKAETQGDGGHGHPAMRAALSAAVCPTARPYVGMGAGGEAQYRGRVYVYGGIGMQSTPNLAGPWKDGTVRGDLWSLGWVLEAGATNPVLRWRLEHAGPAVEGGGPAPRYGASLTVYDPLAAGAIGSALACTGSGTTVPAARSSLLSSTGPKLLLFGGRDTCLEAAHGPPDWVPAAANAACQPGSRTDVVGGNFVTPERSLAAHSVPSLVDLSVWDCDTGTWMSPVIMGTAPRASEWHSSLLVKQWLFVFGGLPSGWKWGGAVNPFPPANRYEAMADGTIGPGYGAYAQAAESGPVDGGRVSLPSNYPALGIFLCDLATLHWTEPVLSLPAVPPSTPQAQYAYVLPPFRVGVTAVSAPGREGRDRILIFGGAAPGLGAVTGTVRGSQGDTASLFMTVPGDVQEVDITSMTRGEGEGEATSSIVMLSALRSALPAHARTGRGAQEPCALFGQDPVGQAAHVGIAEAPALPWAPPSPKAARPVAPSSPSKGFRPSPDPPPSFPRHAPLPVPAPDLTWADEADAAEAAERSLAAAREAEAKERVRAKAARKWEKEQARVREVRERADREREAARGQHSSTGAGAHVSGGATGATEEGAAAATPPPPPAAAPAKAGKAVPQRHTLAGKLEQQPAPAAKSGRGAHVRIAAPAPAPAPARPPHRAPLHSLTGLGAVLGLSSDRMWVQEEGEEEGDDAIDVLLRQALSLAPLEEEEEEEEEHILAPFTSLGLSLRAGPPTRRPASLMWEGGDAPLLPLLDSTAPEFVPKLGFGPGIMRAQGGGGGRPLAGRGFGGGWAL
jgi:hypothetical protein